MDLNTLFQGFNNKKVLIVGDAMIDAYMWGEINRMSPEAPVPVVEVKKHENRLGGAANVALNLKALGATPRSVIQMILQESVFITTISGYLGLLLGIFVLESIGLKLEDFFIKNPFIDVGTAIAATVVLIIFGAVAGYIPAKRAARIKPIVALRDE